MTFELNVENVKCGGCATAIRNGLEAIPGIEHVDVDIQHGIVRIEGNEGTVREAATKRLQEIGYPERG